MLANSSTESFHEHYMDITTDLQAAALILPRDGRQRLTVEPLSKHRQGPQQMEQIRVRQQPHQRTAFDQTGALIGDHRWMLDQARVGQRFPMLLPGLGLAIVDQLNLQNRQRPWLNREQYRLPQREDLIAQQKDYRRA